MATIAQVLATQHSLLFYLFFCFNHFLSSTYHCVEVGYYYPEMHLHHECDVDTDIQHTRVPKSAVYI